jgi:hypothetical protein
MPVSVYRFRGDTGVGHRCAGSTFCSGAWQFAANGRDSRFRFTCRRRRELRTLSTESAIVWGCDSGPAEIETSSASQTLAALAHIFFSAGQRRTMGSPPSPRSIMLPRLARL